MASARREARAGLNRSVPGDDEPPEWLWGFSLRRWLRGHDGVLDGYHDARMVWQQQCREWLDARGLVEWGHAGMSWEEYKRIEREEPHRILRRPEE